MFPIFKKVIFSVLLLLSSNSGAVEKCFGSFDAVEVQVANLRLQVKNLGPEFLQMQLVFLDSQNLHYKRTELDRVYPGNVFEISGTNDDGTAMSIKIYIFKEGFEVIAPTCDIYFL